MAFPIGSCLGNGRDFSPALTSRSNSRPATGRSDCGAWTGTAEQRCGTAQQRCGTAPPGGGLLGRFENVRQRPSAKRIVPCNAATPEYYRHEFLQPYVADGHPDWRPATSYVPDGFGKSSRPHGHVRPNTSSAPDLQWRANLSNNGNYAPSSDLQETKFHRGFQRRMKADIQVDAARMQKELANQWERDQRDRVAIDIAKTMKERVTFNLLTGEGVGREYEDRPVGKRIVNPFGCMEAIFSEHARDTSNRMLQSRHRFYGLPGGSPTDTRSLALYNEGLTETQRQASLFGTAASGPAAGMPPRTRVASRGVADNFAHLRGAA